MFVRTCIKLVFVIVVMTKITKEHFLKFVACLYGPNVATYTDLLQAGPTKNPKIVRFQFPHYSP